MRFVATIAAAVIAVLSPHMCVAAEKHRSFYGGIFGNYTHLEADTTQSGSAAFHSGGGVGAGAILGVRSRVAPNWFLGLEADFIWDNRGLERGTTTYTLAHWGTVRGLAGYQLTPVLSVFASAGLAIADVDYTTIGPDGSDHLLGFAASTGIEIQLIEDRIFLRAEYLYATFEEWRFNSAVQSHTADLDAHVFRLGVIYKSAD